MNFEQLRSAARVELVGRNELGSIHWIATGGPAGSFVQTFEEFGLDGATAFVSLHEAAHLFIQDDYDHDVWKVFDVEPILESGDDYVVIARVEGTSLAKFDDTAAPAPAPPALAELRETLPKLVALATDDRQRFLAELVARKVLGPDRHTVYVESEHKFRTQELAPTPAELRAWLRHAP